ncbi:MAG: hypothetical protein ACPG61_01560 [Paracoccaceae bacterium]
MPLHILIIMVVIGIGGIALLLHLTGRSRTATMTETDAQQGWARHYPNDTVQHVTLAHDGKSALVLSDAGPGVLWVFGLDTVARHLRNCDVSETETGLRVDFHDYAVPPARFALSQDERTRWQSEMRPA